MNNQLIRISAAALGNQQKSCPSKHSTHSTLYNPANDRGVPLTQKLPIAPPSTHPVFAWGLSLRSQQYSQGAIILAQLLSYWTDKWGDPYLSTESTHHFRIHGYSECENGQAHTHDHYVRGHIDTGLLASSKLTTGCFPAKPSQAFLLSQPSFAVSFPTEETCRKPIDQRP
ncbi:hypothetical protein P7K49_029315 [Saguinus oedipus]|uniref:Uncharacterized protein n=1 Tax=Saguinus oedipus TaxID=9490 RepID=A0ABQ9U6V3_SAGOE|nr:hypothetical protein P7K49_029315 [Saguinus oedipus]